jgi:hypothetical protein
LRLDAWKFLYCRHRKIERARRRFGATVEIRVAPGPTLISTDAATLRARTFRFVLSNV